MNEEPPPPPSNGNRRFALRVVILALAAIVVSELVIVLGRGVLCALKGGCGTGDWDNAGELLNGLIATLIALVFALIGERKP